MLYSACFGNEVVLCLCVCERDVCVCVCVGAFISNKIVRVCMPAHACIFACTFVYVFIDSSVCLDDLCTGAGQVGKFGNVVEGKHYSSSNLVLRKGLTRSNNKFKPKEAPHERWKPNLKAFFPFFSWNWRLTRVGFSSSAVAPGWRESISSLIAMPEWNLIDTCCTCNKDWYMLHLQHRRSLQGLQTQLCRTNISVSDRIVILCVPQVAKSATVSPWQIHSHMHTP